MFDSAKNAFSQNGIGLSRTSRAYVRDFLNSSASNGNSLFSAQINTMNTVDGMITQIMAKRSGLSTSQLAGYLHENPDDLQGNVVDEEV